MPVRFIHTADWQIGKNYDQISEETKRVGLRRVRLETVATIGNIAREKSANFIVVAGDLFDSPTADNSTVSAALSAIGQLGIPVFAIPGNHDHGGPGGLWEMDFFKKEQKNLAPNLTVLLTSGIHESEWAWILPCPLLRRSDTSDPTSWVRKVDLQQITHGSKPVILLAHGSVQSFDSSSYDDEEGETSGSNLINLNHLPAGLVDYAALGDWHGTKQIEPWAFYSGTHEPDRFNKGSDHDPGNILLVEVSRGTRPRVEKISTAAVDWHTMEFSFTGDTSLETFKDQLLERFATRVNTDLLQLDLSGSLGLEETRQLRELLGTLEARLLRLKLRDNTRVAATAEEIQSLTTQNANPLIAGVAATLLQMTSTQGEQAEIAAAALHELFAATTPAK